MLIENYSVSLFVCVSCDAPSASGGPEQECAYCGRASVEQIDVGVFDHDIRVLNCESCGAPQPVPRNGGELTCAFCQVRMTIHAQRGALLETSSQLDEPARIALLRSQRRSLAMLPEIRPLMKRGGLVDDTCALATTMWNDARAEVRRIGESDAARELELELFQLTELLADYHNWKQRPMVARGFLESAIDELSRPHYLQPLYCWLARNAAVGGDEGAARQWLEHCDQRPERIDMDSALRFAWATISVEIADYETVLRSLGRSGEIPIAAKYAHVTLLYRSHAVEMLDGADAGADILVGSVVKSPYIWLQLRTMIDANQRTALCPLGFELAARRTFSKTVPCLVSIAFVSILLLIWLDRLAGPALWGQRQLPWSATIALTVVDTIFVGGVAWALVTARKSVLRVAGRPRNEVVPVSPV